MTESAPTIAPGPRAPRGPGARLDWSCAPALTGVSRRIGAWLEPRAAARAARPRRAGGARRGCRRRSRAARARRGARPPSRRPARRRPSGPARSRCAAGRSARGRSSSCRRCRRRRRGARARRRRAAGTEPHECRFGSISGASARGRLDAIVEVEPQLAQQRRGRGGSRSRRSPRRRRARARRRRARVRRPRSTERVWKPAASATSRPRPGREPRRRHPGLVDTDDWRPRVGRPTVGGRRHERVEQAPGLVPASGRHCTASRKPDAGSSIASRVPSACQAESREVRVGQRLWLHGPATTTRRPRGPRCRAARPAGHTN